MDAKTSADKRARVLSAAEKVFLDQGYARTTMGDLASQAGMSRPALYLVYARKHELFSSIIQDESRCNAAHRSGRSEADSLQHWMMWVCDLWLGEHIGNDGDPLAPHLQQRMERSPKEVAFLQSILQDGLSKRLSWAADNSTCVAVARLLTFCVCGLMDSSVGADERKALLAVQIDALSEAALRPATSAFDGSPMPIRSKAPRATERVIAAR